MWVEYVTFFAGLLAGFIDSIAGGGGLITLPVLIEALGPSALAVGTNKLPGTIAALVAFWVYQRKGHFVLKQSLFFCISVGVGAILGSFITPSIPPRIFTLFIFVTSPVVLWLIFRRDLWTKSPVTRTPVSPWAILGCGFVSGIYDGMWGPGGGTFMFLSLFFVARFPLMQAIASSKLANLMSASFSLASFSARGYVHWKYAVITGLAIGAGAFWGARLNANSSAKWVRPILVVVVSLLLGKELLHLYARQ